VSDMAVQIDGVVKIYGAQRALDGLTLNIPKGSIYGLLGPNGAGKSTAFGVMCGWLQPTTGSARVLGVPSSDVWRLAGRVTALPQDAAFPAQLTIRQQLAVYARAGGIAASAAVAEADRVLAMVGLSDAGNKRGNQLSHGMHKRAGLAQALLGNPEVIFLDEPTSGLDPVTARSIKDLIGAMGEHATVVVSSHNLMEVQEVCTHGAILDHGRLLTSGTISDLTRRGAEISIGVRSMNDGALKALQIRFGMAGVIPDPVAGVLRICFEAGADVADINRDALRILLDNQIPILDLSRGTSLERAFIAMTGAANAS
jgi:ABC-2 type transport system ATP-binding protein